MREMTTQIERDRVYKEVLHTKSRNRWTSDILLN